jgi:response regulator RpfG family c-di-GMP phosphodiesterase
MPGLSGTQLYERISHVNPNAADRVIFMTGDVVSDTFQNFLKEHRKACLSKPFSVQEFRRTINHFVLDN